MQRTLIGDTPKQVGKSIKLCGWVNAVRAHGKVLFIDLRDKTGTCQIVFTPGDKKLYETAEKLRPEWVVSIEGMCQERPEGMQNEKIETGRIEILAAGLQILNESKTPPFEIAEDSKKIKEEVRMKYRYLDLRTKRMKNNIILRHKVIKFIRDFMDEQGFIEIQTPMLTKSTPEGSRDYIVPSRLHPGQFYALPQSPQQFKQLLMVAGIEKYFQIAKCLRDEDTRGDRQPEHTQLDVEMAFIEQEDIIAMSEQLLIKIVKKFYPEKTIQEIPFPRMTYKTAVEKYGTDKPDLRKNTNDPKLLAFVWVIDFPFFEKDEKTKKWTFTHNPFSAPKQEFMQDLLEKKNIKNILTTQYDVVLNGTEIGGGSIRNHKPEALEKVFEIMGYKTKEIKEKFGHMLEALSFGAPPHGGIAWGLDRLIMLLANEESIREVIAFPKTGDGRDLMMQAPSEVTKEQLKELGLKTIAKK